MVGRELGLWVKQAFTILRVKTISLAIFVGHGGYGRRWSNLVINKGISNLESMTLDEENNEVTKSPGCSPNNISSANTPKLYTSHFSFTSIVYASSL